MNEVPLGKFVEAWPSWDH